MGSACTGKVRGIGSESKTKHRTGALLLVLSCTYRPTGLARVGTGQAPTGGTTFADNANAVAGDRHVLAAHVPLYVGTQQAGDAKEKAGPKDGRNQKRRPEHDPANGRVVVLHVLVVQIKHGDYIVIIFKVRVVPHEVACFRYVSKLGRDLGGIRSVHFDGHGVGVLVVLGDDGVGNGGALKGTHVTEDGGGERCGLGRPTVTIVGRSAFSFVALVWFLFRGSVRFCLGWVVENLVEQLDKASVTEATNCGRHGGRKKDLCRRPDDSSK
jgi:hypothetical protein